MKARIITSIIAAALASSAAQAGTELSIEKTYSGALSSVARDDDGSGSYYVEIKHRPAYEKTYSGALPSITRNDDGSGSYYVETKTQHLASISIPEASEASAAKAGTNLSTEDTYSGALPSITRDDYGLGSYYVESRPQPACTQYDLNPLSIIYPEQRDSVNDYLVPQSAHIVCLRENTRG